MDFPSNVEDARNLLRKASERALDILSSHDPLVKEDKRGDDQAPIELIKHLMRLIHSHCNFDCTLICLPSGSSGLLAIAGVGRNAAKLTTKFHSGGVKEDIFKVIMDRKTDTFIDDVHSSLYAKLIPGWYRDIDGAKSFVMLPLVSDGKLLGLIYGDYSKPHTIAPTGLAEGSMLEWRSKLIKILRDSPKWTA